jgi:hypothetical protein
VPGSNPPGDLPPDLPPEYADAYRRGFERAYAERTGQLPAQPHGHPVDPFDTTISPPAERAEFVESGYDEGRRRSSVVPVVMVALALLLILGAYGAGKLFSQEGDEPTAAPQEGGTPLAEYPGASDKPDRTGPYQGPLTPVAIGGADASCTSEDGVDAAGNPTSYDVSNVYDGKKPTAWRCDGNGVGETVTLQLPGKTTIGQVGLIAGYAKTDPQDGSDRYAENNRITRVRWTFDDGTSLTQDLDGSAQNRSMQTKRIPPTSASSVTIEILDSTRGPRNTVAISGVELGAVKR